MENYKIGYTFNTTTGELLGTETVWLERATGRYPHAANVTLTAPPEAKENKARLWDGKKWKYVPDYRGTVFYNENGFLEGTITELGEDIKGKITKRPPEIMPHHVLAWNGKDWETPLEKGYIEEAGEVRPMTQAEKIISGIEALPEHCKIQDGEVVLKTQEELLDEGKITLADYNEYVREQREAEYRRSTDKIGLMVLRGEATKREWEDAILAVKVKWPYKE